MNRYFGLHTLEGEWHALLPRYLLLAERVGGRRVLDIGCGSGIGASLLLELGAEMVDAIDHRPAVLELARMKHAKQGLDFQVMFWEELDFEDDTFDLVLCLDPTSPVTDPSLIQEVQRVLKPGGEYVCAIERKQIPGLEVILPRYGYTDAAENIDVHPHAARPPQVGELQSSFAKTSSVIQRPSLSFVFDAAETPAEEFREIEADGESATQATTSGGEARSIPVDDHLQRRDADEAAVEIWFCGASDTADAPMREVRLPYFGLVERLRQVHDQLQIRQVQGIDDEDSIFDDIVDGDDDLEAGYERDRQTTNQFRVVSFQDEMKTNIRNDLAAAPEPVQPQGQMESQLNELAALYQQVRHDFQNVVRDAQNALQERDHYIEHLVHQVHDLQERFRSADPEGQLGEMTNVFDDEQPAQPAADDSVTKDASAPPDDDEGKSE